MNNKNNIITIAAAVILIAAAFFLGRCTSPKPEEHTETKSDTVYIEKWDTIKVDTIVYKWKRVKDTIYLPADTALLVEEKVYEDSISTLYISGVNCELDSIEYRLKKDCVIITNETTITISEKKRWKQFVGFGVHLGVSAGFNPIEKNAAIVAPEIGVGFVYGFGYTW